MSIIAKFEKYNLQNKQYKKIDTTDNSDYFNIFNLRESEYGLGRHAFTLYGSDKLIQGSEVYIEIIDKNGNGIKCRGAKTKVADPGWYIWFEVSDENASGPATIYIAGTAKGYNQPWGGFDNLNVLWSKKILINKNLPNDSKLVFQDKPYISNIKQELSLNPENPLDVQSSINMEIRDLETYSGKVDKLEIYYKKLEQLSDSPQNYVINGQFSYEGFLTNDGEPTGWKLSEITKLGFNWDRGSSNSDLDTDYPNSLYLETPTGGASGIQSCSLTQDNFNLLTEDDYSISFFAKRSMGSSANGVITVNVLTRDNVEIDEWEVTKSFNVDAVELTTNWDEYNFNFSLEFLNSGSIDIDYKPTKLQFIFYPPTAGEIYIDGIVFNQQLTDAQASTLVEQNNENLLEDIGHFNYKGYFPGWVRSELPSNDYRWNQGSNSPFDKDVDSLCIVGPDVPFENTEFEYTLTTENSYFVLREKYNFKLDSKVENYYGSGKIRVLKYDNLTETTEEWKEYNFSVGQGWTQIEQEIDFSGAEKAITEIKIQIVFHHDEKYKMHVDNVQFNRKTFSDYTYKLDDKWNLLSVENIDRYIIDTYNFQKLLPDNFLGKIISFKVLIKNDIDEYARTYQNNLLELFYNHVKFDSMRQYLESPIMAGNGLLTGSMYLSNVLYSGIEFGGANSGFIRTVDYPGWNKSLLGQNAIYGNVSGSISGSISSSVIDTIMSGSYEGIISSSDFPGGDQYYSGSITSSKFNGTISGSFYGFITGSVSGYASTYDAYPDNPLNYRFPWMALAEKETAQGHNGFMLWSGSVMPDSGTDYDGVGIELIADSESYLRFRTNPSELDIRAKSFYVGDPNSQFISGSGGNIEISSSIFHLSGSDLIFEGTGSFGAGDIGGWQVYPQSLESPNYRPESGSIGINLASTGSIDIISGSDGIRIQASGSKIFSKNYTPLQQGMYMNPHFAEFGNVRIRGELRTAVFKKDLVTVSNGYLRVTDSSVLSSSLEPGQQYLQIKDNAFETGDILYLKDFQNGNIEQEYMRVISGSGDIDTGSLPSYVNVDFSSSYAVLVERNYEGNFWEPSEYFTGSTWEPGTAISADGNLIAIEEGSPEGYLFFDASSEYSPYMDVVIRTGSQPEEGKQTKARLGRLAGIIDEDLGLEIDNSEYGLYTDNAYLKGGVIATFGSIGGWQITSSSIEKSIDEEGNKLSLESDNGNGSSSIYFGQSGSKTIEISNNKTLQNDDLEIQMTENILSNNSFETGDLTDWSGSFQEQTTDVDIITDDLYYFDGTQELSPNSSSIDPYSGSYMIRVGTKNSPGSIPEPKNTYFFNNLDNKNYRLSKIIDTEDIDQYQKLAIDFNILGSDGHQSSATGNTQRGGLFSKVKCRFSFSDDQNDFSSGVYKETEKFYPGNHEWKNIEIEFSKPNNKRYLKVDFDFYLYSLYSTRWGYINRGKIFLDKLRFYYGDNATLITQDGILLYNSGINYLKLSPSNTELKLDNGTITNFTASNLYIDNYMDINKGSLGGFQISDKKISYTNLDEYEFGLDGNLNQLFLKHTSSQFPELEIGESQNSFDSIKSGSNMEDITDDYDNMNFSFVDGTGSWDITIGSYSEVEVTTDNLLKFYIGTNTLSVSDYIYSEIDSNIIEREFNVNDIIFEDDFMNINIKARLDTEIRGVPANGYLNYKLEGKLDGYLTYTETLFEKNNENIFMRDNQIFNICCKAPANLSNIKLTIEPNIRWIGRDDEYIMRSSIKFDYIELQYDRKRTLLTNEGLLLYHSPNKFLEVNEDGLDFPTTVENLIDKKYVRALETFAEEMLIKDSQNGVEGSGSLFYYDYDNNNSIIEVDKVVSRLRTTDGFETFNTIRGIGGTAALTSRGTIKYVKNKNANRAITE